MNKARTFMFALGLMTTLTGVASAQQQTEPSPPAALAAQATPPPPRSGDESFVDKAKQWARDTQIVERMNGTVDGWYPRFGGMTRGSGFSIGPGYRTHVPGDILVDLSAAISARVYKAVDARVRWVQLFDDRLEVWTDYRYEDFPQEDFFGRGFDSSLAARTAYRFTSNDIDARGIFQPVRWARIGTTIGYMSPEVSEGRDEEWPSIERLFTDAAAPGLLQQPSFLHTTVFGEIDTRNQRGNPSSGGMYKLSLGNWNDRTLDAYNFRRLDATAMHYVPVSANRKHVVLARIGTAFVNNTPGNRVPFYFLPYVGGVDTIRSYREFRFKDENALWMSGEYIYTPMKYFSLAAFVDGGKVAEDWQDLDFSHLKGGYGGGFRVHTSAQTFARFDIAHGGEEGWRMFLKVGPSF
jgi:outer membrane protein assembly factor BamA